MDGDGWVLAEELFGEGNTQDIGIMDGGYFMGVAFVWFTTHFGGGFASGAQIYSYYVRYGIWCLIMPGGRNAL